MAEAFLRKHGGGRFEAHSAGLEPGAIHPYTSKVMEEVGIPLSGHRSKDLHEIFTRVQIEYLVTVCSNAEQECPILPGVGVRMHWPFEDPVAFEGTETEKLTKFREIRCKIDERVRAWLDNEKA
jgi:arsenate reductase